MNYQYLKGKIRFIILLMSVSLYLISLTQKAFCTSNGCGDSLAVVLSGGFGFFLCFAGTAWLANPLIWLSWLTFNRKHKKSFFLSLASIAFALSFLFYKKIVADESGFYSDILSYQIGYWLWASSIFILFLGNLILYVMPKESAKISNY